MDRLEAEKVNPINQPKKAPIKQPNEPVEKEVVHSVNDEPVETVSDPIMDFVIRCVPGYGFLPIIKEDEKEVYRGEFQKSADLAFNKCMDNSPF